MVVSRLVPPIYSVDDLLRDCDEDLYAKYKVLKKQLMDNIQTRWCSRWPEGNDHGPNHIERVLANVSAILGRDPIRNGRLSVYELFLTAIAVVTHDIGIIDGRKHHAIHSAELLDALAKKNIFMFDEHSTAILGAAIRCHSSSTDIEHECREFSTSETLIGHVVRPRFIAGLVRLADELDEDRRRAERWVQDLASLPAPSQPYWEFCQRITGVEIGEYAITFNVAYKPEDVGRLVHVDDATESFVRFVAKKFVKINAERERVKRYINDLARNEIRITARAVSGLASWSQPRTFVLSDGACASPKSEAETIERFVHTFSELERSTEVTQADP